MKDKCMWQSPPMIFEDGNGLFKIACNQHPLKYKSIPNNFSFNEFRYCPFCGRKIEWVKSEKDC
jgi:hypothetical protein